MNTNDKNKIQKPRYRTILADPPWDVQQIGKLGAVQHYNLMSLERIAAMPVGELAADDAHLWLWVTNATLRAGYDVMEAWGFHATQSVDVDQAPARARELPA
jgi:N6-adenosine-specific RNA methylase IME4